MKLREIKEKEYADLQARKQKEMQEIEGYINNSLTNENFKVLSIKDSEDDSLNIDAEFTLDEYTQNDTLYWGYSEDIEEFVQKVKRRIDYIKKLRADYPDFCKQNDFIQSNRNYTKTLSLTHMGYERNFGFTLELADYLKLPNTTSCSTGGGDYEIKRTPKRVEEYNKNIDTAVDFLIDCIAELRSKKYKEDK